MKTILTLVYLLSGTSLLAQKPITSIPFQLFGDHIIIQVSIDNHGPFDFILDTGSGLTVLDEEIADELSLKGKNAQLGSTADVFEIIKHNEIEINGFPMEKNVKVYATNLEHLEISVGRNLDGIVGYDLIHHHTIRINYDSKTLDIYDHGNGPKEGDAVPFNLHLSIPTIKGSLVLNNEELLEGSFFIITGAGTTLDLNSPFSKENDIINKTGKHYSYLVKSINKKETLFYEGHVRSFMFGDQKVEDLPIGISTANAGIQADKTIAGIIGNEILSMFNITIDVPDKMMYLTKNSNFGKKFIVNCSGIDLQLAPDKTKILVHQVIENSPASKAGIKPNSEIIAIDGLPAEDLTLPEIEKKLKKEGESVTLKIKQDHAIKEFTLSLSSLIE